MVKLVYDAGELGPISLDFFESVITVGSAEGNDLVLPHASIWPNHCRLVLEEDRVIVCLQVGDSAEGLRAKQFACGIGERFILGELTFEVQKSGNTVSIPRSIPENVETAGEFSGADAAGSETAAPSGPMFYCSHCQQWWERDQLTRIGLEGKRKHLLCPECSRPVWRSGSSEAMKHRGLWSRFFRDLLSWFAGKRR